MRRGRTSELQPVTSGSTGLMWIYAGLAMTIIPLAGTMVWTVVALAKVNSPPAVPTVTIDITGHQWWWEARYRSTDPSRVFTTANEIHIPVGEPVRIELRQRRCHPFVLGSVAVWKNRKQFQGRPTWCGFRPIDPAATGASAPSFAASSTPR